jgi:hypothetical protein
MIAHAAFGGRQKAKGKNQKAKVEDESSAVGPFSPSPFAFCLPLSPQGLCLTGARRRPYIRFFLSAAS